MRLSTGFGGIEETAVLKDLWELSRDRLTLEGFLRRHGYHGAGEGEPLNPSWRHQPSLLTQRIASYRSLPEDRSPAAVEQTRIAERQRAESELIAALGKSGRVRAIPALRMGARFIRVKETGKVAYTQAIDAGRCAAHVLGEYLVKADKLDESTDVFFLTLDELTAGTSLDARELVAARRAKHAAYSAMRLPSQWIGSPHPRAITVVGEGLERIRELSGVPICEGIVEGRVHVVTDPDDVEDFEPGDVLACHVTDPSWMPLLNIAGALVIDVGGPMSHCAIAARELGIPAVISTGNGTELLRTGDTVRVDAGAGLVTIMRDA
jgi:pyruvate,water dikinase